jgi:hypothetical protein
MLNQRPNVTESERDSKQLRITIMASKINELLQVAHTALSSPLLHLLYSKSVGLLLDHASSLWPLS